MNLTQAKATCILQAAEYKQQDIDYILAEFPEISPSDLLEAIRYSCITTRESRRKEDVTYQIPDIEMYKEDA